MTPLLFPATVTRQGARIQASLVDFPAINAEGATEAEIVTALQPQLQAAVLAFVEENNTLPRASAVPVGSGHLAVALPPGTFTEKASEKLLEFTKAEFDRVLASSKLAEERAKQNGTYALAAIPILSFLQPDAPTVLYNALQFSALALAIVILALVAWTLKSQTLSGIGWTPEELEAERETVYRGYRPYADLLYVLQTAWINGTVTLRRTRDVRFDLVDWQHGLLVPLAALIAALLVLPALG